MSAFIAAMQVIAEASRTIEHINRVNQNVEKEIGNALTELQKAHEERDALMERLDNLKRIHRDEVMAIERNYEATIDRLVSDVKQFQDDLEAKSEEWRKLRDYKSLISDLEIIPFLEKVVKTLPWKKETLKSIRQEAKEIMEQLQFEAEKL